MGCHLPVPICRRTRVTGVKLEVTDYFKNSMHIYTHLIFKPERPYTPTFFLVPQTVDINTCFVKFNMINTMLSCKVGYIFINIFND